jgi:rhodanese-related sulfurtransferase
LKTFLIVFLLFFVAWDLGWWAAGVKPMLPWELKKELAGDKPPLLLDVRTSGEYAMFHIPGALSRPQALSDPAVLENIPRDREVVVVCMTGHRSPIVAKKMLDMGFTNVSNLTWGSLGWLLTGGDTVKGG